MEKTNFSVWRDEAGVPQAMLAHFGDAMHVALFASATTLVGGSGADARSAYHAAWRALRLQRHNDAVRTQRRQRHAAAIRAHRTTLTAQRRQYEESLRACRRSLLNALNQRNAVASRITKMQAMITEARSKSPELRALLGDMTTDDIEAIVMLLLEHVVRSAEYHRRATAAEARAEELARGQQSLVAAAKAAGFEYTVSAGAVRFTT